MLPLAQAQVNSLSTGKVFYSFIKDTMITKSHTGKNAQNNTVTDSGIL